MPRPPGLTSSCHAQVGQHMHNYANTFSAKFGKAQLCHNFNLEVCIQSPFCFPWLQEPHHFTPTMLQGTRATRNSMGLVLVFLPSFFFLVPGLSNSIYLEEMIMLWELFGLESSWSPLVSRPAKLSQTYTNQAKPSKTKPNLAKPSQTWQNQAKPSKTYPNLAKPSQSPSNKISVQPNVIKQDLNAHNLFFISSRRPWPRIKCHSDSERLSGEDLKSNLAKT